MTVKNVYLTIDDAPSKYLQNKIDFLSKNKIPAIFFCRGEFIAPHTQSIIDAIQKGFLIGNHSYTHPYFSKITLEQCFDEILKTEILIEKCYQQAKIKRPIKVIRLPFGDRGINQNIPKIQNFLKKQGFVASNCDYLASDNYIDILWDWDPLDYKTKFINNTENYINLLAEYYKNTTQTTQILLLHDFEHNQHLFEVTMEFLLSKNINFLSLFG